MKKLQKIGKMLMVLLLLTVMSVPRIQAAENSASLTNFKMASDLDSNFNTKITLLLNRETDEEKILDVVFVLDVENISSETGKNMQEEAYHLIESLNSQKNIKASIAMVGFGYGSTVLMDFTDSKEITSKSYLEDKIAEHSDWISNNSTGTNIQSGLETTKKLLDSSTSGSAKEDRHVILLTDGSAFTYNNADGETATTVYGLGGGVYLSMGNMDSNGDVGNPSRETKMVKYYNETNDYAKAFSKLMEEGEAIDAKAEKGYKFGDGSKTKIESLVSEGKLTVYTSTSQVNNLDTYPYTNLEMGTYRAAKVLEAMKDEGYNIYTIGYLYQWGFNDDGTPSNRLLGYPPICFLYWTETVGQLFLHNEKNIDSAAFNEMISEIDSAIVEDIQEESYIVDEMGFGSYKDGSEYEFDFVNDLNKIAITLDGTVLDKTKIEENVYGFGKDDSIDSGYKFILRYEPSGIDNMTDNECFKLDINFRIDSETPVQIEYYEVLKEESRKNSEELNGDEILKASNKTILYTRDGEEKEFNIPTLSLKTAYLTNPETSNNYLENIIGWLVILMALSSAIYYQKKRRDSKASL